MALSVRMLQTQMAVCLWERETQVCDRHVCMCERERDKCVWERETHKCACGRETHKCVADIEVTHIMCVCVGERYTHDTSVRQKYRLEFGASSPCSIFISSVCEKTIFFFN
jgi:hypothetical protein